MYFRSDCDKANKPEKRKTEVDRSLCDGKSEPEQSKESIHKLNEIIRQLYEDNIEGKISHERFIKMSGNFISEFMPPQPKKTKKSA